MTALEPWFADLVDAGGDEIVVPMRLVISAEEGRRFYRDYCADVAWYRERGELDPDHPDQGYATGTPHSEREYLLQYVGGIVDDVTSEDASGCYRIEAPRAANSQSVPRP